LSEAWLNEIVPTIFEKPRAERSLLTLSMALINTIPAEKDEPETLSPLYLLLKSSIWIVEAASINTLEVVQARLLVALYEVEHGIPAAFMSLAATARAAVLIELNRTFNDASNIEKEEGLRVWWGSVSIDFSIARIPMSETRTDIKILT
jgi:hypothetical protein